MKDADDVVAWMRLKGVRRMRFSWPSPGAFQVEELELFDTIPAPPLDASADDPIEPENKGPGTCIADCRENNGWHFDPRFCAAHGRRAAGVKP